MNPIRKLSSFMSSGNNRTVAAKKNIAASFLLKAVSIIISLQVVPLTIDYVNPTQYGIWLTLSSIIAWVAYFDLGFAHGFRNRFAEARAKGDDQLAKQYVSTTYAVLAVLFLTIFFIVLIINHFLNWSNILNIDSSFKEELRTVFAILACFFCLNIIASVFTTMLTADQKPALTSFIQTLGQAFAFLTIYVLTKTTDGGLTYLAFAFSGIPCFILIVMSVCMFRFSKYRSFAPSIKCVKLSLIKSVLGLGGQFFIIMISMLFIFQFINLILTRIEGPDVVTQVNIAYKYFNVLNMVAVIVLTPFWSAFTDAYVKQDFVWMRKALKKLELLWLLCIPVALLMLWASEKLYSWWIGNSVHVPFYVSIVICIYVLIQTLGNVYMYMINGTGKVRIQLIIYASFAIISLPLLYLGCKYYGVIGIYVIPVIVFAFQALLGKLQINKLVNNRAKGIWNE